MALGRIMCTTGTLLAALTSAAAQYHTNSTSTDTNNEGIVKNVLIALISVGTTAFIAFVIWDLYKKSKEQNTDKNISQMMKEHEITVSETGDHEDEKQKIELASFHPATPIVTGISDSASDEPIEVIEIEEPQARSGMTI